MTTKNSKKIVISILNYNGRDNTFSCLDSLNKIATEGLSVECIVIDNASTEHFAVEKNQYENLKLTIIRNKKNLGFAGGQNIGLQHALDTGAKYVLVLNNDTLVDTHFLSEMVAALERDDAVAATSPKIYFAPGTEFHHSRYSKDEVGSVIWYAGGEMDWQNVIGKHRGVDEVDKGQFDQGGVTDFATGCCMLIRTDALRKAGLFDDRYFLYYEDSDLQERLKSVGYRIYYEPNAIIWHKNAAASGGSGSPLQDYYISRNRLLFGFLYAPMQTKFALLREAVRLLITGRKWQKRGVRDFFLSRFGKGSYQDV